MKSGVKERLKRALAGCLFIGAVFTWVSGLLSARQAEKPAPKIDVPADAGWDGSVLAHATDRASQRLPPDASRSSPVRGPKVDETGSIADAGTRATASTSLVREHDSDAGGGAPLVHASRFSESPSSAVARSADAGSPKSDVPWRPGSLRVEGQDLVAALERSLAAVRAALPARGELDLDALAGTLAESGNRGVEARAVTETSSREDHGATDADPGDLAGRPMRDDHIMHGDQSWRPELTTARSLAIVVQLDSFLAEHPLNDIRIGPSRKLAQLGPLLVGEGDELIPSILKVKSIEPSAVILSTNDGERRIERATSVLRPNLPDPELVAPELPTSSEDRRNTALDGKKSRASGQK